MIGLLLLLLKIPSSNSETNQFVAEHRSNSKRVINNLTNSCGPNYYALRTSALARAGEKRSFIVMSKRSAVRSAPETRQFLKIQMLLLL